MEAVRIPVVVGVDRRLVIDLPATTPIGPADVVIVPRSSDQSQKTETARAEVGAKLLAAGFLSTSLHAPAGATSLSDEELARVGRLAPGARPSEVLIDEDRGAY